MVDYKPCPQCGSTEDIKQRVMQTETVVLDEYEEGEWDVERIEPENLEVKSVWCDNCQTVLLETEN